MTRRLTPALLARTWARYADGMSLAQVAHDEGVSIGGLSIALRRAGYTLRLRGRFERGPQHYRWRGGCRGPDGRRMRPARLTIARAGVQLRAHDVVRRDGTVLTRAEIGRLLGQRPETHARQWATLRETYEGTLQGWRPEMRWFRRQPQAVRAAYLRALGRFDPPIPRAWRARLEAA